MKVKRLPKDPGPAAWNAILPDRVPTNPLEDKITADWLVIGAGFAGLAAARRLAQNCPGDRIVILDAKAVAEGPAGRNSGFMIDLPHDLGPEDPNADLDKVRHEIADNRKGIAFATEMAEEYGLSEEAFNPCGKHNLAVTNRGEASNAKLVKQLSALNEPFDQLSAADAKDLTGIDYYSGGLYTPGAVMIQPAIFVRGVAAGVTSNRVTLHENSPVLELKREGDWIATTPKGQITAPKVILAVNGHLNNFGIAENRLMHVFTYASMTRALTPDEVARLGGQPVWGTTPADMMGSTIRRISGTGGDRIVVRNTATFDPSIEVSDRRIEKVGRNHDASFEARFPMLKDVEMEFRWGGRLCMSYNKVQMIGELEKGLYSACVQNGLGTAKGTLAGMLAADLTTGVPSDALDRALAAPEPSHLPPRPISWLGANARMRWGEWKAGAER
ncbi:MAG: FAD-binding oxidoreductase [Pseudomonadota bacterium]